LKFTHQNTSLKGSIGSKLKTLQSWFLQIIGILNTSTKLWHSKEMNGKNNRTFIKKILEFWYQATIHISAVIASCHSPTKRSLCMKNSYVMRQIEYMRFIGSPLLSMRASIFHSFQWISFLKISRNIIQKGTLMLKTIQKIKRRNFGRDFSENLLTLMMIPSLSNGVTIQMWSETSSNTIKLSNTTLILSNSGSFLLKRIVEGTISKNLEKYKGGTLID
jgi:hypothetical protein